MLPVVCVCAQCHWTPHSDFNNCVCGATASSREEQQLSRTLADIFAGRSLKSRQSRDLYIDDNQTNICRPMWFAIMASWRCYSAQNQQQNNSTTLICQRNHTHILIHNKNQRVLVNKPKTKKEHYANVESQQLSKWCLFKQSNCTHTHNIKFFVGFSKLTPGRKYTGRVYVFLMRLCAHFE